MAKFAVDDKVEVASAGLYEGVTATVEEVVEWPGATAYHLDLDVGGKLFIAERGVVEPGGRKAGTYRFEVR